MVRRLGPRNKLVSGRRTALLPGGRPWTVGSSPHRQSKDMAEPTTPVPAHLLGYAHPMLVWGETPDGAPVIRHESAARWVEAMVFTNDGPVGLWPYAVVYLAFAWALAGTAVVARPYCATRSASWTVSGGTAGNWPHRALVEVVHKLFGFAIGQHVTRGCRMAPAGDRRPYLSWKQITAAVSDPDFTGWLQAIADVPVGPLTNAVLTGTDLVLDTNPRAANRQPAPLIIAPEALARAPRGSATVIAAVFPQTDPSSGRPIVSGVIVANRIDVWRPFYRRREGTPRGSMWARCCDLRRSRDDIAGDPWSRPSIRGPHAWAITYECYAVIQLIVTGTLRIALAPQLSGDGLAGCRSLRDIAAPTGRAPAIADVDVAASVPADVTWWTLLLAYGRTVPRGIPTITIRFDLFEALRHRCPLNDLVTAGPGWTGGKSRWVRRLQASSYVVSDVLWGAMSPSTRALRIGAAIRLTNAAMRGADMPSAITVARAACGHPGAAPHSELSAGDLFAWVHANPIAGLPTMPLVRSPPASRKRPRRGE